jgi:hypothetical protein
MPRKLIDLTILPVRAMAGLILPREGPSDTTPTDGVDEPKWGPDRL